MPLRVILRGDVAMAPGEDPDVQVASYDIGLALCQGTLIGGYIVFHSNDIMPHAAQNLVGSFAIFLQVVI